MKAIILAGGEGTRLRPLTNNRPKPMIELMDKPVLEHTIELLKRNGITDICITLRFLPKAITGYFGDGSDWGVRLESRVERKPMGTAGSVCNCADFIGEEDCLIISGDAVCDFDLDACAKFHKEKQADATIVLYNHPEPLEYGLVVTNNDARVERFIEKPAWGQILTDQINTGIYLISPQILSEIPKGETYDFGRDLFPKLLQDGKKIYGITASGYWCDIGSPEAYRTCCRDILDGKCKIEIPARKIRGGVWADSVLPEQNIDIIPPVYIGKNVTIAPGAKIGPYTVLNKDSAILSNAVLRGSVLLGATVGENAYIDNAILGWKTYAGSDTSLREGCVIGDGTVLGRGVVVQPNTKIWPGRCVPPGTMVSENLSEGMLQGGVIFENPGIVKGEFNITITPENCMALGASLGEKQVGIAHSGGEAARILADALACGVCAAGGQVLSNDASSPAMLTFICRMMGLDNGIFVWQKENTVRLTFCGQNGNPLRRAEERKIEAASSGQTRRVGSKGAGGITPVTGVFELYTAAAAQQNGKIQSKFSVSVTGSGSSNRALRAALSKAGIKLCEKRRGIPELQVINGGFDLLIRDENDESVDLAKVRTLAAFAELVDGSGTVAVPQDAPAAVELLAKDLGAVKVFRVGRDGPRAERLLGQQPFMTDGVFAAVKICAFAAQQNETIVSICTQLPHFFSVEREVMISGSKSRIMRELTLSCAETAAEMWDGLRLNTGKGWVHVSPCSSRPALRIRGESESMEMANELCSNLERTTREIEANNADSRDT